MNNNQKFCSFSIEDALYGIDICDVKEIKYDYSMTIVRHAPKEIQGLVNVRGLIYIILNMRVLLNIDTPQKKNSILILIKPHISQDPFGIKVDNHSGVLNVRNENIDYHKQEKIDGQGVKQNGLIKGVCRIENKLMTILDSHKLLNAINWT